MAVVFNGENVGVAFPMVKYVEKPKGEFYVRVFDYDGTLLDEKWLNNGDTYEFNVTPPTHDKANFAEWSSSQEIVDGKITIDNANVMIGAIYTPKSGLTEFDIEVNRITGKTVTCNMVGNKNWGDGTSDDLTTHDYADYGEYTITCDGTSGVERIMGSSPACYCLKHARLAVGMTWSMFGGCVNLQTVMVAPLAVLTSISGYVFDSCWSLKCVVLPDKLRGLSLGMFQYCKSLSIVVIPKSVVSLSTQVFYGVTDLEEIALPKSVTNTRESFDSNNGSLKYCSIPCVLSTGNGFNSTSTPSALRMFILDSATSLYNTSNTPSLETVIITGSVPSFSSCFTRAYSLKKLMLGNSAETISYSFQDIRQLEEFNLPETITSITNSFTNAYSLKKIKFPKNLTTLSGSFGNCYSLELADFTEATAIPTMSSSCFSNSSAFLKIVVPDALYDEWIVATNWAGLADKIYKASEVQL